MSVAILGLVTNVAYGVAYYSYGVLIDPVHTSLRRCVTPGTSVIARWYG